MCGVIINLLQHFWNELGSIGPVLVNDGDKTGAPVNPVSCVLPYLVNIGHITRHDTQHDVIEL